VTGWSRATFKFASKLEVNEASKEVIVTREIDGGEEVSCKLSLVVTTDLRGVVYLRICFTYLLTAYYRRLNGEYLPSVPYSALNPSQSPVMRL